MGSVQSMCRGRVRVIITIILRACAGDIAGLGRVMPSRLARAWRIVFLYVSFVKITEM